MIVEYRFGMNIFYSWSGQLLPGFFTVSGILPGGAVDELGRRLVRGPAEVSLEAVTMLALALPIAACGKKGPLEPPQGVPNTYPRTYPSE